jgi:hypothetical protein
MANRITTGTGDLISKDGSGTESGPPKPVPNLITLQTGTRIRIRTPARTRTIFHKHRYPVPVLNIPDIVTGILIQNKLSDLTKPC